MSVCHYCKDCGGVEDSDNPHNHAPKQRPQINPSAEDIRKHGRENAAKVRKGLMNHGPFTGKSHARETQEKFSLADEEPLVINMQSRPDPADARSCPADAETKAGVEILQELITRKWRQHATQARKQTLEKPIDLWDDLLDACDSTDKQAEHHRLFKNEVALKMTEQAEQLKAFRAIVDELRAQRDGLSKQLTAKDEALKTARAELRYVWQKSVTLFEAKDRCKRLLEGEADGKE